MDLSIIVVNWHSTDYLRACLDSVYKVTEGVDFEIIVVDNASGDGCKAMLQSEFPSVLFIDAMRNRGFAQANNLGYLASRGEALLFLNPDTELFENAVGRMLIWMKAHPSVGALGPCLLNKDGSVQQSCVQSFPTLLNQFLDSDLLRGWFPRWRLWGTWPLMNPNKPSADVEVDAISGACFLMRRDIFEAVGGFTEEYFMYSDDIDLSYKIRRSGSSIVCLTDCLVVHYGGGSSDLCDTTFAAVQRRRAMAQFFRRTRGPFWGALYRVMIGAAALARLSFACGTLPIVNSDREREALHSVLDRWRAILVWAWSLNRILNESKRSAEKYV